MHKNNPEKLADLVARFCAQNKMNTPFLVSGGAIMHLIHAFADRPDCRFIPMHHEQSAAMAADAYSRSCGSPGLAIATSGPGATNLITGIAGAFYDSIPVFFITGQVSTKRMTGTTRVRQIGFQETPIVSMVKDVTKYSVQVKSAESIRFELEKAFWVMCNGRPGPVLVDIPDDIQRNFVVWDQLEKFVPEQKTTGCEFNSDNSIVLDLIKQSTRPVIIGGWGIHIARAESGFKEIVDKLKIPTVLTWGAADILNDNSPYFIGTFGTHGSRKGNFAVQNADLIISIGSRLDTKATGSPISTFAREAKKVVVDIDEFELRKFEHFGLQIDVKILADAKDFIKKLLNTSISSQGYSNWFEKIENWGMISSKFDEESRKTNGIDPYSFMKKLVESSPQNLDLFLDTGCLLPWILQDYSPKIKHRLFHDFNNTAMGWSIPALVGGLIANPQKPAICIVGDGSFMMSIQELATLSNLSNSVRILLIDNSGYSMIRQTQDQWLKSNYQASSQLGGLNFPNFEKVSMAFGFEYLEINNESEIDSILEKFWEGGNHKILRIVISPETRVIPQVKFGRPNEDMDPLIQRKIFLDKMLIKPLPISQESFVE